MCGERKSTLDTLWVDAMPRKSVASPVHDIEIAMMGAGSTLTESPNIYIYLPKYYKVGTGKPHERDYIHYKCILC